MGSSSGRTLLAGLVLLPLAIRHLWIWGGALAPLLNLAEALVLALLFIHIARAPADAPTGEDRKRIRNMVLLAGLAFVVLPNFLSDDLRDYLMRGRLLAVHGANPYLQVAADFPTDPYVQAGLPAWAEMPCPYGPLAAELQGGLAWVAEGVRPVAGTKASIAVGLGLFKLLGWLALLATAGAARAAWRGRDGQAGNLAWVAVAASPFLLLELVGMAHNDAWMVCLATWAVTLAGRDRFGAAGALLVVATLVKPPAALLWPLVAGRARNRQGLVRLILASAATALPLLLYSWWRFFPTPDALAVFSDQAALTRTSLRLFLGLGLEQLGLPDPRPTAHSLTLAVFLLLYGRWVILAWQDRAPLARLGLQTMLAAAFLALGLTNPWYLAWAYPLAWFPGCSDWRSWARLVDLLAPLSYLVHLGFRVFNLAHQAWQLALLGGTLVLPRSSAPDEGAEKELPGPPGQGSGPQGGQGEP